MDAVDVLARWGIKHLSPSSINCWAEDRATWVLRYGLKSRDPSNPAMIRGNAVESGLKALLYGLPFEEALRDTTDVFAMEAERNALEGDDLEAERANLEPMLRQCVAALEAKPLPIPNATQIKCESWIDGDGWSVPLLGFADFAFDGWTLDCKTTKAMPSSPKAAHLVQVAFYAKARGEENAALLYVTPKKFAFYDVCGEEIDAAWNALTPHARSLLRALYRAKDVSDLAVDCPPPIDHWSWDAERRAKAASLLPAWNTQARETGSAEQAPVAA